MCAYNFILAVILTVVGIIYFCRNEGTFSWTYLYQGFIAGAGSMVAQLFTIYAINVPGAPQGPRAALVMSARLIILVILDAITMKMVPNLL